MPCPHCATTTTTELPMTIHLPERDTDMDALLDALAAILARIAREKVGEALQSSGQPIIEQAA
jgi:hypothetical protein